MKRHSIFKRLSILALCGIMVFNSTNTTAYAERNNTGGGYFNFLSNKSRTCVHEHDDSCYVRDETATDSEVLSCNHVCSVASGCLEREEEEREERSSQLMTLGDNCEWVCEDGEASPVYSQETDRWEFNLNQAKAEGILTADLVTRNILEDILPKKMEAFWTKKASGSEVSESEYLSVTWNLDQIPEKGIDLSQKTATASDAPYMAVSTASSNDAAGTLKQEYVITAALKDNYKFPNGKNTIQVVLVTENLWKPNWKNTHEVTTVNPSNVTFNLFDYWRMSRDEAFSPEDERGTDKTGSDFYNKGINNAHTLKFGLGNYYTGWNAWPGAGNWGPEKIVQSKLQNGVPVLNNEKNESLAYLFDPDTEEEYRKTFMDVKGLLQIREKYGDYYYDSTLNGAVFDEDNNEFTVYDTMGIQNGQTSPDGQFFPFIHVSEIFKADEDANGNLIRTGKVGRDVANHYFGLTMEVEFYQPDGGQIMVRDGNEEKPQDMRFIFSGDDDVWIFVDDILIGDMGGIHDEETTVINFATGEVKFWMTPTNPAQKDEQGVPTTEEKKDSKYIGEIVKETGIYSLEEMNRLFKQNADGKYTTFRSGTEHTLKMFYMERGHYDSNFSLSYNLAPPLQSTFEKLDQNGTPVAGAEFRMYASDKDGNYDPETDLAIDNILTGADGTWNMTD